MQLGGSTERIEIKNDLHENIFASGHRVWQFARARRSGLLSLGFGGGAAAGRDSGRGPPGGAGQRGLGSDCGLLGGAGQNSLGKGRGLLGGGQSSLGSGRAGRCSCCGCRALSGALILEICREKSIIY
jgi:hypothetical protein